MGRGAGGRGGGREAGGRERSVSSGSYCCEKLKRDVQQGRGFGVGDLERMPQLARNSCSIFYSPESRQAENSASC